MVSEGGVGQTGRPVEEGAHHAGDELVDDQLPVPAIMTVELVDHGDQRDVTNRGNGMITLDPRVDSHGRQRLLDHATQPTRRPNVQTG